MENNDLKGKIAIVGLDCRMPGADNSQEFWKNLLNEKESLTEFTEEQLEAAGISSKIYNNLNYVRRRGVVKDAEMFDAEFFNFTPREAELLDPQHRLFLECSWHALEDAGIDPFRTDKKISVFGGTGSPYHLVDTIENKSVLKYANGTSIITSNDKDYVTTRVSYKLNLTGCSINVQSACSTSMVSVILGIDNLLNYQSDVVLAGGATIELPVAKGYMYQSGSLESPDGKCRTFDKNAQGTVFSRGAGVVALKRLEDAIEDKDHIYAVILGGAVNNDGNRKAGYTAPSVQGQVEVITETIELSGIDPRSITMVEAHGTATPIGDPIEISSLSEAFSLYTKDKQYCAIGSVKTNIGHTDVASGIASLIKTCMSLKYGYIPASLNFNESNPAIDFEESPFYVNTTTKKWNRTGGIPRRALVNSFGVGGTNACVILEEPPVTENNENSFDYDTVLLSAHHKTSFSDYSKNLIHYLKENPGINLNTLAHTSRTARKPMKYKGIFPFKNREDLIQKLEKSSPLTRITSDRREIVFMFPGQGNQFVEMGKELYLSNADFKNCVDYCAKILEPTIDLDIRKVLFPDDKEQKTARELIDQTYITQPAIFIISYALAKTILNYGIKPDKLIGHSVGEYVAAVISGIMTLEDALTAVAVRGKLVFSLPKGSMLAVLMSEEELKGILPQGLCIAVINSPELVVVSGKTELITAFAEELKQRKIFTKLLPTSHAFHSTMMEPCLPSYRDFFLNIPLNTPTVPIISTVTGDILTEKLSLDHEYWVQHVEAPVRFGDAVSKMLEKESVIFLECGPGQSLESAVKRRLSKEDKHAIIGTLHENSNAITDLDTALGRLWGEEIYVDFDLRYNSSGYTKMRFPLLPFNRKPFMIDFSSTKEKSEKENTKKTDIKEWYYMPAWKKTAAIDFLHKNPVKDNQLPVKWIVFTHNDFSDAIVDFLRSEIQVNCITVKQGSHFDRNDNNYTIRISEKEDYVRLFKILNEEESNLHVIYTWNFEENYGEEISLQNAEFYIDKTFYSLLYLEQAIIANNSSGNIRISCLINDAFDIVGTTDINVGKSLATGPLRALFKEHNNISTLLINIDGSSIIKNKKYLIGAIVKEAYTETNETVISYIGKTRWTEIFEKVKIADGNTEHIPALLKENGVYFISGGAGGIGRAMSLLIAEKLKHSILIWTGRNPLPEREEWEKILSDENTKASLRDKIMTIKQIEDLGSVVQYYDVGVTDFLKMKYVLEHVITKFGKINGVIHSAGIAGGGVIALKEKEDAQSVILPKVKGTLILKELLKDKELDFITLFSSITAILGEAGRVDYISANAFMDAAANKSGFLHKTAAVTSVNWGQWGLVGMAADWQVEKNIKKSIVSKDIPLSHSVVNNPIDITLVSSEDENQKTYFINVNPDDHWIFNEHLLTGIPAMVGTSYIETLVKWQARENPEGRLKIKNAKFVSPLMIMKNMPRALYLFIEKKTETSYKFIFRSTGTPDLEVSKREWKDHFEGELNLDYEQTYSIINLESISETMAVQKHHPHQLTIKDSNNKPTLQYSKRWDCKKTTFAGKKEWLTKLILDEEFMDDLSHFYIHPAIMDVATSAHFMHMNSTNSFLPFSYGEVNLYHPFESELYSHATLAENKDSDDNFLIFDFKIYNNEGRLIMKILNYSFIKIATLSKENAFQDTPSLKHLPEAEEADILPDEGKIVLEDLLNNKEIPQIIVYTKDLETDFNESKISYLRRKLHDKIKNKERAIDIDDRPDLDIPYAAPENEIEKSIGLIWTGILGINKIGINDSFISLGGNSLLAIQVVSGIKEEFNVEIATDEFVNNSTILKLSELVLEKILGEHAVEEIEMLLKD